MHRLNLFFILFFCSLAIGACRPVLKGNQLKGSVYVFDSVRLSPKGQEIFPIVALRIDSIGNDAIHVKYKFGTETFADLDFVFKDSCKCYVSTSPAYLRPFLNKNEYIYVTAIGERALTIGYRKEKRGSVKELRYTFSYKMKIDHSTNRNLYYAEDGYKLADKTDN